ncbi:CLUMA_CG000768, isoform A [Clunio marinus]|uniref:CLUMA_CG000768, isoform A n=1 Tax=Clunio marinus TaxID=568069 RepID=A0A1J1HG38_9DIPT|nr:CLUMA_CG000768, isoform A [Clunio marinus]
MLSLKDIGELLLLKSDGSDGCTYATSEKCITVGTSLKCQIKYHGEDVKPEHFSIYVDDYGQVKIANRSTENPVKVNDVKVENKRFLKSGDVIDLLGFKMRWKTKADIKKALLSIPRSERKAKHSKPIKVKNKRVTMHQLNHYKKQNEKKPIATSSATQALTAPLNKENVAGNSALTSLNVSEMLITSFTPSKTKTPSRKTPLPEDAATTAADSSAATLNYSQFKTPTKGSVKKSMHVADFTTTCSTPKPSLLKSAIKNSISRGIPGVTPTPNRKTLTFSDKLQEEMECDESSLSTINVSSDEGSFKDLSDTSFSKAIVSELPLNSATGNIQVKVEPESGTQEANETSATSDSQKFEDEINDLVSSIDSILESDEEYKSFKEQTESEKIAEKNSSQTEITEEDATEVNARGMKVLSFIQTARDSITGGNKTEQILSSRYSNVTPNDSIVDSKATYDAATPKVSILETVEKLNENKSNFKTQNLTISPISSLTMKNNTEIIENYSVNTEMPKSLRSTRKHITNAFSSLNSSQIAETSLAGSEMLDTSIIQDQPNLNPGNVTETEFITLESKQQSPTQQNSSKNVIHFATEEDEGTDEVFEVSKTDYDDDDDESDDDDDDSDETSCSEDENKNNKTDANNQNRFRLSGEDLEDGIIPLDDSRNDETFLIDEEEQKVGEDDEKSEIADKDEEDRHQDSKLSTSNDQEICSNSLTAEISTEINESIEIPETQAFDYDEVEDIEKEKYDEVPAKEEKETTVDIIEEEFVDEVAETSTEIYSTVDKVVNRDEEEQIQVEEDKVSPKIDEQKNNLSCDSTKDSSEDLIVEEENNEDALDESKDLESFVFSETEFSAVEIDPGFMANTPVTKEKSPRNVNNAKEIELQEKESFGDNVVYNSIDGKATSGQKVDEALQKEQNAIQTELATLQDQPNIEMLSRTPGMEEKKNSRKTTIPETSEATKEFKKHLAIQSELATLQDQPNIEMLSRTPGMEEKKKTCRKTTIPEATETTEEFKKHLAIQAELATLQDHPNIEMLSKTPGMEEKKKTSRKTTIPEATEATEEFKKHLAIQSELATLQDHPNIEMLSKTPGMKEKKKTSRKTTIPEATEATKEFKKQLAIQVELATLQDQPNIEMLSRTLGMEEKKKTLRKTTIPEASEVTEEFKKHLAIQAELASLQEHPNIEMISKTPGMEEKKKNSRKTTIPNKDKLRSSFIESLKDKNQKEKDEEILPDDLPSTSEETSANEVKEEEKSNEIADVPESMDATDEYCGMEPVDEPVCVKKSTYLLVDDENETAEPSSAIPKTPETKNEEEKCAQPSTPRTPMLRGLERKNYVAMLGSARRRRSRSVNSNSNASPMVLPAVVDTKIIAETIPEEPKEKLVESEHDDINKPEVKRSLEVEVLIEATKSHSLRSTPKKDYRVLHSGLRRGRSASIDSVASNMSEAGMSSIRKKDQVVIEITGKVIKEADEETLEKESEENDQKIEEDVEVDVSSQQATIIVSVNDESETPKQHSKRQVRKINYRNVALGNTDKKTEESENKKVAEAKIDEDETESKPKGRRGRKRTKTQPTEVEIVEATEVPIIKLNDDSQEASTAPQNTRKGRKAKQQVNEQTEEEATEEEAPPKTRNQKGKANQAKKVDAVSEIPKSDTKRTRRGKKESQANDELNTSEVSVASSVASTSSRRKRTKKMTESVDEDASTLSVTPAIKRTRKTKKSETPIDTPVPSSQRETPATSGTKETAKGRRKATKTESTPVKRSRRLVEAEEEVEEDKKVNKKVETEEEPEAPTKPKRGRKAKTAEAEPVEEPEKEEEEVPEKRGAVKKPKTIRASKRTKTVEESTSIEAAEEAPKPKRGRKARTVEPEGAVEFEKEEEVLAKRVAVKNQKTTGKRTKLVEEESTSVPVTVEEPEVPAKRKRGGKAKNVDPEPEVESKKEEEEVRPKRGAAKKPKTAAANLEASKPSRGVKRTETAPQVTQPPTKRVTRNRK